MTPKQLIIVPHCFISNGFSPYYNDEMKEVFEVMVRCNTELIQMPCPHLMLLSQTGVPDKRIKKMNTILKSTDVESLKTLYLKNLSLLVAQVRKFRKAGIPLAGIIGVKGSPTCQVGNINKTDASNTGLFMEILSQKLKENAINTTIVNLKINNKSRKRKISKLEKYEKM